MSEISSEQIRESDVGHTCLRMFGWTWNTRRILPADVGKRVTMSSTECRISIEGDSEPPLRGEV